MFEPSHTNGILNDLKEPTWKMTMPEKIDVQELVLENKKLVMDLDFLLQRSKTSGHFSFSETNRCTGVSSNALVIFAFSGVAPNKDHFPSDPSDYKACLRTIDMLPNHRRTEEVFLLLNKYRLHVKNRYPDSEILDIVKLILLHDLTKTTKV